MEELKIVCSDCKKEYSPLLFVTEKESKKYKHFNCYECRKIFIYRRNLELQKEGKRHCSGCKKAKDDTLFFSKKQNKYVSFCLDCRKTYAESL